MKKLGKLKLNQINKTELEKRDMNALKGGMCSCSCLYYEENGVDTYNNGGANAGLSGEGDDKQSPGDGGYCFQNNTQWICTSGY